jgi:dihydrofolate reductase
MTRVRVDLMASLDGYTTTTDQTPEEPFGKDWSRLTAAYAATRTFRARVLGDTSGKGTAGLDEVFAARYFEGVGAEIMGAAMFGLHEHGDDPDWKGWWGDSPPFECPVFVLTHMPRASIPMPNATVFHFLSATPEQALEKAVAAANGLDVRVGGGPTTVRSFLKAGLVDDLHVAVTPILLGGGKDRRSGINLWEGLRGLDATHQVTAQVADTGIVHYSFHR